MIFPANDNRVLRIIKKIIRGLSYHHKNQVISSDSMIWCDVQRFIVPDYLKNSMESNQVEDDIIKYHYEFYLDKDIWSSWIITFYEKITFYGFVTPDFESFSKKDK